MIKKGLLILIFLPMIGFGQQDDTRVWLTVSCSEFGEFDELEDLETIWEHTSTELYNIKDIFEIENEDQSGGCVIIELDTVRVNEIMSLLNKIKSKVHSKLNRLQIEYPNLSLQGFFETSCHRFTKEELFWYTDFYKSNSLNPAFLKVIRNEIFARHGYVFIKGGEMDKYFRSKEWYTPKFNNINHLLSDIEKHNIKLIKELESEQNYVHLETVVEQLSETE